MNAKRKDSGRVSNAPKPHVIVVDSDAAVRDSMCVLLQSHGIGTRAYASATAFLREVHPEQNSCIVLSVDLPGLNGLDLLAELYQRDTVISALSTTKGKVWQRTMPRRPSGTAKPPNKGTSALRPTLAICTKMAREFPKTTLKP